MAQLDRGSIAGVITDSSGAAIPNAQILITDVATGVTTTVDTQKNGEYLARSLRIDTYRVTARRDGFQTTVQPSVPVGVNQVVRVDLTLQVGTYSQTVEVSGEPPLVPTETSSLGTIETAQRITDLPLNGRNFIQLAYLGPGANLGYANTGANRGTTDNARPGIAIAVNGLSSFDNNFLLDGVDNNEWGQGTLVIQPSPDAIQEFSVEENSMKAEFGNGGAAINVVLRSGTNSFHGSAFEFLRNNIFDARNFFASGKPPFHLNQFGGSLGGPIVKDKTFFFMDYQGQRLSEGLTFVSTVPTAAEHQGDFSAIQTPLYNPYSTDPNTQNRQLLNAANPYVIPTSFLNPAGVKLVNLLPLPNLPGVTNNYIYQPSETNNVDQFDVRVDQSFSEKDQLFVHAAAQAARVDKPAPLGSAGGCCQGYGSNIPTVGQNYAVGWNHELSPNALNSLRFGFVRWSDNAQHILSGSPMDQIGVPNADRGGPSSGLSLVSVAGYTTFGSSQYVPEIAYDNTYQIAEQFSLTKGLHSIKIGGDFRLMQRNFYQAQAPFGFFAFTGQFTQNLATGVGGNAIADILLGLPLATLQDGLSQMDRTRVNEFDIFAQDDWRITPSLTLNLGLRYDVTSPVGGAKVGNFDLQKGYVVNNFGPNGVTNAGVGYDWKDIGPRVGLAWAPTKSKRTTIRGAYGIFYSSEGDVFNDIGENPPVLQFYSTNLNPANIPTAQNLLSSGFPAQLPSIDPMNPTGEVKTNGPIRKIPRIMEWNVNFQQQFGQNWLASIAYVGTHASDLWANETFNLDQPVQPADSNFGPAANYGRPYYSTLPGLNTIYPIDYPALKLNFNALETKLEKRFTRGSSLLLAYTYGSDRGSAEGDPAGGQGAIQNPYNLKEEYGNVAPDFTHYFVASYVYDLPFGTHQRFAKSIGRVANSIIGGWEVSGITTARSGEHFTPCLSFDPTNTGTYCAWPDKVGNPYDFSQNTAQQAALGCPVGHQSLACWYNQGAFTIPALQAGQNFAHQFGNSGNGTLVGPRQVNFNFALLKTFAISDTIGIQFRAEAYDLFNHPQFALPSNNPDVPGGASISSTLADNQRELQFALKLLF